MSLRKLSGQICVGGAEFMNRVKEFFTLNH